ncbi:MAG: hypothetical protein PHD54_15085 [Desulfuromonadaceae bacterium]|nr:hypothetical protein [Desulfuromonadaceae bacterium]
MKRILSGVLLVLIVTANCFAWDPSGSWGIDGRSDATLKISCTGDSCEANFQSAYSKAKATGYVLNDKLALAYNEYTHNGVYFMTFEKRGDAKMSKKTFDLAGKHTGGENWVRK